MLRKIVFFMCFSFCMMSSSAFSASEHVFRMGSSYEFTLPPNTPQVFNNIFFWPVSADCNIISTSDNNLFSFTVLRKAGSLNNIPLSQGDAMVLVVHPGDIIHITAESGGRIELTNHSDTAIKASCSSTKSVR